MPLTPHDPTRAASVGSNEVEKERADEALLAQPAINVFRKGVVVEVLGDPQLRTEEFFKEFLIEEDPTEDTREFSNSDDLEKAPRNSLIIRDITNGAGKTDLRNIVCFPFFSSHIMMPVKPGETVWFLYPTPSAPSNRAYWLSRTHDLDYVEDVNFSHHDRRHDDVVPDEEIGRIVPSLHNGTDPEKVSEGPDKAATIDEEEDDLQDLTFRDPDAFIKIRNESLESPRFCIEPVPRLTKRPGDLVLQGSNNTTIVLGTDRGFGLENRPTGENSILDTEEPLEGLRGSIDLVAGRGRFYDVEDFEANADVGDPAEPTRTRITQNAEEGFETNKNIANDPDFGDEELGARVNLEADPNEGDPDFINDASRLYIAIRTDVDANFGSVVDNIPEAYDADPSASTLQNVENSAAVALKSDEIRIIARKTGAKNTTVADAELFDAADAEINGSIRIIKEGDPKDDAASIYLLPDGTIQITGKKIMIGKSTDRDEGTAAHANGKDVNGDEVGKTEPYMRYTEFNQWAEGLIDAINLALENINVSLNDFGAACDQAGLMGSSGGAGGAIPAPNVPLGMAVSEMMQNAGQTFDGSGDRDGIEEFKDTTSIKSKRIFGE